MVRFEGLIRRFGSTVDFEWEFGWRDERVSTVDEAVVRVFGERYLTFLEGFSLGSIWSERQAGAGFEVKNAKMTLQGTVNVKYSTVDKIFAARFAL